MKKLIPLMALMTLVYTSNAQYIKEGRSMLGINFNSSHRLVQQLDTVNAQPVQKTSNNDVFVGLNYGHMISDHFMLGATIGYQTQTGINDLAYANGTINKQTSLSKNYSAGLFTRYYRQIGASKFYMYGEGFVNLSLGTGDYKSQYTAVGGGVTNSKSNTLSTTFKAGITPGIAYFINKHIGLEASLGSISFSNTTNKMFYGKQQTRKTTDASFNSNLNLRFSSLLIGVTFYFGV